MKRDIMSKYWTKARLKSSGLNSLMSKGLDGSSELCWLLYTFLVVPLPLCSSPWQTFQSSGITNIYRDSNTIQPSLSQLHKMVLPSPHARLPCHMPGHNCGRWFHNPFTPVFFKTLIQNLGAHPARFFFLLRLEICINFPLLLLFRNK